MVEYVQKSSASLQPNSEERGRTFSSRPQSFLRILAAFYAACVALVIFNVAIDPFDLYPWGVKPKLERPDYDTAAVPWVATTVTKGDYDTFLLGGSTSVGFRASDMQELLPSAQKAFNLAMLGPSGQDFRILMDLVANAPKLKRVIVQLESTFLGPLGVSDPRFVHIPAMFDPKSRLQSLRAAGVRSTQLAWKMLLGQEYYMSDWDPAKRSGFLEWAIVRYTTPSYMERLAGVIEQNRHKVVAPLMTDCSDFPMLKLLADFADELAKRNVELDVLFPVYSRAFFFEIVDSKSDFRWGQTREAPYARIMSMRSCAVRLLAENRNAKVFQFDKDESIAGDYANYGDPAHINNVDANRQILRAVAEGKNQVTLANLEAYEKALRASLSEYKFRSSPKQ